MRKVATDLRCDFENVWRWNFVGIVYEVTSWKFMDFMVQVLAMTQDGIGCKKTARARSSRISMKER